MGFTRRLRLRKPGALLPHHFALTRVAPGGMFLWHFPSGFPARPLAGIVALWSPDFPLPALLAEPNSGHPDDFPVIIAQGRSCLFLSQIKPYTVKFMGLINNKTHLRRVPRRHLGEGLTGHVRRCIILAD